MKSFLTAAAILLTTACSNAPMTETQKAEAWASGICMSHRLQGIDAATYASKRMTSEVNAIPNSDVSLSPEVKALGNQIARQRGCIY
jgi:hypothetical protein